MGDLFIEKCMQQFPKGKPADEDIGKIRIAPHISDFFINTYEVKTGKDVATLIKEREEYIAGDSGANHSYNNESSDPEKKEYISKLNEELEEHFCSLKQSFSVQESDDIYKKLRRTKELIFLAKTEKKSEVKRAHKELEEKVKQRFGEEPDLSSMKWTKTEKTKKVTRKYTAIQDGLKCYELELQIKKGFTKLKEYQILDKIYNAQLELTNFRSTKGNKVIAQIVYSNKDKLAEKILSIGCFELICAKECDAKELPVYHRGYVRHKEAERAPNRRYPNSRYPHMYPNSMPGYAYSGYDYHGYNYHGYDGHGYDYSRTRYRNPKYYK